MSSTRLLSVILNDGHFMPMLGFGTSAPRKVAMSNVEEAVQVAIDVGYRHIDSAYSYLNEEAIGQAIRKKIANGTVKRTDIFYTTKMWGTFSRPELVQRGLELSLQKLQLSYVNLYLVHYPVSLQPGEEFIPMDSQGKIIFDTVDLCSMWERADMYYLPLAGYTDDSSQHYPLQAMEKCKDAGLARSIGVSNFNRRQLEMILNKPGLRYKPVCNQVECHPYLNQSKLLEYCKSKDIVMTGYAALGSDPGKEWVKKDNPVLLEDPVLNAIAEKHRRTPAQVALRYQLQRGVVVLAKSFTEKRIKENFQLFSSPGLSIS
ncbi:prostaglandin-E(2) 9-reductase-like isoform X2 [Callithrix jacchus]|uniref:prostaglandin-E(2) 9-reductase-like isoform X2 n=1 Tax=Callithrix jacchus TaxID=9483 RepID=UPI00159F6581|nr:prostaglandin-E(2) 9-reductase-like isoform X2 [Callithrix jacchus]